MVAGNKYEIGSNAGRPAHYETPEDLIKEVIKYFNECKAENIKATVTGLTLFLGFSSRSSLDDYANRSDEFSYIIKRAKLAVENSYELSGTAFDIFALKNMGWKDRSEIDHLNPVPVTWVEEKTYETKQE
jgi:hypothetical protein